MAMNRYYGGTSLLGPTIPPMMPPMMPPIMPPMYPPSMGGYGPMGPYGGMGMGGYGNPMDPYGLGYGYGSSLSYYDPYTGMMIDDDPAMAYTQGYHTGANSIQNYTLAMSAINGGRRSLFGRGGLSRRTRNLLSYGGFPGIGGSPWG